MERVTQLKEFVDKISGADLSDDAVFRGTLQEGIQLLEFVDEDCARLFDVSRPTITRWRNGTTAPHRAMRAPLCSKLRKEASGRLRRLRLRESRSRKFRQTKEPATTPAFAMSALSKSAADPF